MKALPAASNKSQRCVEIAKTPDKVQQALDVRAICFVEERGFDSARIFDANDDIATHILVSIGDEPIGSARLLWFPDHAKIERTGFRKEYRNLQALGEFAAFVFEHVTRRGVPVLITHAEWAYARLWRRLLGFEITQNRPVLAGFPDVPYYELVKRLSAQADAEGLV